MRIEILLSGAIVPIQIADARNPSPTPIAFYTIRLKVVKTAAAMMTMGGSGADSRSRGGMRTGERVMLRNMYCKLLVNVLPIPFHSQES